MITDWLFYLVAIPAVFLTGISKGGFGGALGGIAVPLMALAISPVQAAAIMLPILCLMDLFSLKIYLGKWDYTNLKIMIPGALIGILVAFWGATLGMTPGIHATGPLGSPALEDDERQAALRKDSFDFCLRGLAILNVLGQPLLMILSHWQHWTLAQTASVVTTAFMLNSTLWGCLPTLYASWNMRHLPTEE